MKRFFQKKSTASKSTSSGAPQQPNPNDVPVVTTLYQRISTAEKTQFVIEFVDAAKYGNLNKVNDCIVNGVPVEGQRDDSWRAIHVASFNGHIHIVKYLIEECRADVNSKTNDGWTALHVASLQGHLEIVRYVVQDCHVDANNTKTNFGSTALHLASQNGHLDIVQYLVETCHADITVTTKFGETAYQIASDKGRNKVVYYLSNV